MLQVCFTCYFECLGLGLGLRGGVRVRARVRVPPKGAHLIEPSLPAPKEG